VTPFLLTSKTFESIENFQILYFTNCFVLVQDSTHWYGSEVDRFPVLTDCRAMTVTDMENELQELSVVRAIRSLCDEVMNEFTCDFVRCYTSVLGACLS
jgi:hypothetical protein